MTDKKLVSFVVPAYNSERTIERCLRSILAQGPKEVIMVDDGSTDSTVMIANGIKGIRVIRQSHGGPAKGRNNGLASAKGDYIAFIDSDVILPKGWARKALSLLSDPEIAGVGGPGISTDKSRVSKALDCRLYGMSISKSSAFVNSIATMDVMYKKSHIKGMMFDEAFPMAAGEDPDFNLRVRKMGHKLLFSRDLWVNHVHPTSVRSLMKKWYRYGSNWILMCSKRPEMRGSGYYARLMYIPLLMALLLISPFNPVLAAVAAIQVIGLFGFYFYIGVRVCPRMVLSFSVLQTMKQLAQLFGIFVSMFRGGRR